MRPTDGMKFLCGIFRIDPRLDGVAVQRDLVLRQRQLFAERHPQLPFDQIDAGDQFGHGMLDLQPRVHFDEEDVLAVGDELDGAGADIVDRGSRLARGGADRLALRRHRASATALPRSPSGAAAAACIRARTATADCRGCRRSPAPRYGADCRRYFSISMRSSPNAALASRLALTTAAASSPPNARSACRGRRRRPTP